MDDPALYATLTQRLEEAGVEGVLFYLAIPPSAYVTVAEQLGAAGLSRSRVRMAAHHRREAVRHGPGERARAECDAARALRRGPDLPHRSLSRQGDRPEPAWSSASRTACSSRSGIAATSTTCRSPPPRPSASSAAAAYYEGAGALRDMVQNHLMQLLSLVAMEPPTSFTAASVRDRKMDALLSVQPLVDERKWHRRRGARAVRAPDGSREARCRRTARSPTSIRRRRPRRSWRLRLRPRQLALGGRAVLPANRQAPAEAHDRDRHSVQAPAAADLQAA